MKESKDSQLIYEAYKTNPQVLNENVLKAILPYLGKIWQFIQSNPEILKQLIASIPELAKVIQPAAPVPSAAPAPDPAVVTAPPVA